MGNVNLVYAPRAQRDLLDLPLKIVHQILDDHDLLKARPWPSTKVTRLRGYPYWEMKTGDYRSLFVVEATTVVLLRIVNRRDLEKAIRRIDLKAIALWFKDMS